MPSLAETQAALRRAVVDGDFAAAAPLVTGGRIARGRLEIHRRHYETSLVMSLLNRFPATAWLTGETFITEAARRFVREHPPVSPCLAEYGDEFPEFLSRCPGAERMPYLRDFAELDSALGQVSLAVDPEAARHVHSDWPIDALIKLYLTDSAPEQFVFEPEPVHLEIRGARGEFQINRLEVMR